MDDVDARTHPNTANERIAKDAAEIERLRKTIAKYERCLPVPDEHRVPGSHVGSVQNYITHLETAERDAEAWAHAAQYEMP